MENIVLPKQVLSKNHVSAAVFKDLEGDGHFQAGGKGPGGVHLANRFLKGAVCELQEAPILRSPTDLETEPFRIAEPRTLVRLSGKDGHRWLNKERRHVPKIHDISLSSCIGSSKDLIAPNFAIYGLAATVQKIEMKYIEHRERTVSQAATVLGERFCGF